MIYCKDCSTTDCPYQKEKEERESNPFKKILGCNEDEVQRHHPAEEGET